MVKQLKDVSACAKPSFGMEGHVEMPEDAL